MRYFPYHILCAATALILGTVGSARAQSPASAIAIEYVCSSPEILTLMVGQTKTTQEFVFKITASKWAVYNLTRRIILPQNQSFSVSNVKFYASRDEAAGNDCTLENNTIGLSASSRSGLMRVDNNFHHALGNRSSLPDETTVWVSVSMDITGVTSGDGTVTVECTIEDYSF